MNEMQVKRFGGNVALKIDIQTAYDTVEWDFLCQVLDKIGMCQTLIGWIRELLETTRISVIVNGQPGEFFGVSRGLKQGDALSPSLFALMEEVLSRNLTMLKDSRQVKPIISGNGYQCPLHLLFADDIIIFANGQIRGIRRILKILERYEKASGQVVNKEKTKLFLGGMSFSRKVAISKETGLSLAELPEKYLGVPFITGKVTRASVANVVDNLSDKLNRYKGRMISFTARAELIKSVLESSTVYSMSIYKWPASIIKECTAKIRNFLWSGNWEKRKVVTVS